jgi:hypothetical protein
MWDPTYDYIGHRDQKPGESDTFRLDETEAYDIDVESRC